MSISFFKLIETPSLYLIQKPIVKGSYHKRNSVVYIENILPLNAKFPSYVAVDFTI